jgi:hypothetical protein
VTIETGLDENPNNAFFIHPNPSEGKFYLEFPSPSNEPTEIMIMDLTGRRVYEEIAKMTGKTEIDLSGQPKGMYFVRIKTEEESCTQKLIIQ